jgi:hypothetical protein
MLVVGQRSAEMKVLSGMFWIALIFAGFLFAGAFVGLLIFFPLSGLPFEEDAAINPALVYGGAV